MTNRNSLQPESVGKDPPPTVPPAAVVRNLRRDRALVQHFTDLACCGRCPVCGRDLVAMMGPAGPCWRCGCGAG